MSHNQPPPRVSIGFPVYNGAAAIRNALDSLLAQTFSDFELIISDNASTDATDEICREYAAQDGRIRYVRQEQNRGAVWNFNEVFRLSTAEYFKWAAYDDICDLDFLRRCVEILDARPEIVWCHSLSKHIGVDGQLLEGEATPEISYVQNGSFRGDSRPAPTRASARPSERFEGVIFGHGGCLDSYGLIRSAAIRRTGLILPYFGAEKVFMAELALQGRYEEIPEALFFARIHPKAAGSMKSAKEQRWFINPLARRWDFPRVQLLRGYIQAVRRAGLPLRERLRCYGVIARYVLQVRKWKGIIVRALTGRGIVGEYPSASPQPAGVAPVGHQEGAST